ncbi:MAG: hypothetical protein Q9183_005338 [Haloplaca sp. 2 TL-2023]
MHSAVVVLFAAGAIAGNLNQLVPRELLPRQDQSFTPTTSFGQGATCADAFGAGYVDCNGVCYNPGQGETCCPGGGDDYPCPSDSFCLNVNGLCCPDGLDAATCASQNGVSLPEDTNTEPVAGDATTVKTSSTVPAVEPTASSSEAFEPASTTAVVSQIPDGQVQAPTSVVDSPVSQTPDGQVQAPYPTVNASLPVATATGPGAGATVAPFEGAAANVKVGVVGVLGLVAMFL